MGGIVGLRLSKLIAKCIMDSLLSGLGFERGVVAC